MEYPAAWKVRGICINAPLPEEINLFEKFVEKALAPLKINTVVLLIRYRYNFKSHPLCASDMPLSDSDAKRISAVCRKFNIRLIPKMNLLGHQSGKNRNSLDGLLRAYPNFDETPELDEVYYCRSLCPNHPEVKQIVFDLADEMISAFNTDALHIGCDEVFDLGICPRCKDIPTAKLFAGWVTVLHDHIAGQGIQTLMWGDRFLNAADSGYGSWEASGNGTENALDMVAKDIIICDWHYEDRPAYNSVDRFADAGFRILLSPWRYKTNASKFIEYAKEHDKGHIEGVLETTWGPFGDLARHMLYGDTPGNENTANIAETIKYIFN